MVGRRFTDDELRQIEAMLEEGLPVREMAKRLRRSRASVKNFCYRKRKDAKTSFQPQEQSHAALTWSHSCVQTVNKHKEHIFVPPCVGTLKSCLSHSELEKPDLKDEAACDDCGLHLGSREFAEKLEACPRCGGHKAHLIK
jgi:hypothetical protein